MCKHVAAVLYGIGARLDQQPDLIFRLHNVDEKELIAGAGAALPQAGKAPASNKVLGGEDLSALFGLDMAEGATTVEGKPAKRRTVKKVSVVPKGKGENGAGKRREVATAAPGSRGSKKR
jgi:uncharacterized Zn finger protein